MGLNQEALVIAFAHRRGPTKTIAELGDVSEGDGLAVIISANSLDIEVVVSGQKSVVTIPIVQILEELGNITKVGGTE